MFKPALKRQHNAIVKKNYSPKLFISFKMAYSCCFSLGGGILDFPDFLQKSFLTSTTGHKWMNLHFFSFSVVVSHCNALPQQLYLL